MSSVTLENYDKSISYTFTDVDNDGDADLIKSNKTGTEYSLDPGVRYHDHYLDLLALGIKKVSSDSKMAGLQLFKDKTEKAYYFFVNATKNDSFSLEDYTAAVNYGVETLKDAKESFDKAGIQINPDKYKLNDDALWSQWVDKQLKAIEIDERTKLEIYSEATREVIPNLCESVDKGNKIFDGAFQEAMESRDSELLLQIAKLKLVINEYKASKAKDIGQERYPSLDLKAHPVKHLAHSIHARNIACIHRGHNSEIGKTKEFIEFNYLAIGLQKTVGLFNISFTQNVLAPLGVEIPKNTP